MILAAAWGEGTDGTADLDACAATTQQLRGELKASRDELKASRDELKASRDETKALTSELQRLKLEMKIF